MTSTVLEGPPEAGELVDVVLDRRTRVHVARVLRQTGTELAVEPLRDGLGARVRLQPEELGMMVWRGAAALVQAPFAVTDPAAGAGSWGAQLLGDPVRAQRRSFVRVDVDLPATLRLAGRTVEGEVVDLSEGGLRFRVDPATTVQDGDPADLCLLAPGLERLSGPLEVVVVRRRRGPGGAPMVLSLRWTRLTIADGDVLRRLVFTRLRERRQAGLD